MAPIELRRQTLSWSRSATPGEPDRQRGDRAGRSGWSRPARPDLRDEPGTVREALHQLEAMRMVETQRPAGHVRPPTSSSRRCGRATWSAPRWRRPRRGSGCWPARSPGRAGGQVAAMRAGADAGDSEAVSGGQRRLPPARRLVGPQRAADRRPGSHCRSRRARRSRCWPLAVDLGAIATDPRRSSSRWRAATWRPPAATPGTTSGITRTCRTTRTAVHGSTA
jgi:hypothetical protein